MLLLFAKCLLLLPCLMGFFAQVGKTDPFKVFFFFFYWVGVESPRDISPATVVVTPFYSSTMVMTVIVSKITQFLRFLNVMSSQHTVSLFSHVESALYFTFDLQSCNTSLTVVCSVYTKLCVCMVNSIHHICVVCLAFWCHTFLISFWHFHNEFAWMFFVMGYD